jgi:hypothetical protein
MTRTNFPEVVAVQGDTRWKIGGVRIDADPEFFKKTVEPALPPGTTTAWEGQTVTILFEYCYDDTKNDRWWMPFASRGDGLVEGSTI